MCVRASYMKMTRGPTWCNTQCTRLQSDTNLHTVHKTTHRLLRTSATTPSAERHRQ